jgi:hypothetical protein
MPEQEYDTSPPVEAPEPAETAPQTQPEAETGPVEGADPEVGLASPTFTVKVDGEDMQVSLEEALSGYQRQSDYTRKTQALASEREQLSQAQQLWDAIERNPQATVAALAAAHGFQLTPQQAAAAEQQRAAAPSDDPFADLYDESPQSQQQQAPQADPRLDQFEQFMQDQIARTQANEVLAEAAAVNAKYGTTVDPEALLEYAVTNNIGSLDAAFRAMSFEAAQQAAVRARTQGRKQQLPPVAGGHAVQPGVLVPGSGAALPTIEDAFAQAMAEADA